MFIYGLLKALDTRKKRSKTSSMAHGRIKINVKTAGLH